MTKEIEKLQELIDNHDNIVFFWRRRGLNRKRHPGFQEPERAV